MKYLLCALASFFSLSAGMFLEMPENFDPKATVACCYLHYQDKVLLLHSRDGKTEGNRWGIPGGKVNKGESLLDAVVREVSEETGYCLDKTKMHFIGKFYIRVPNFDFEYNMFRYTDEIPNPGDVKIDFQEHKGFTWVTPEDALKMDLITDEDTCFELTFGLNRARK